MQYDVVFYTPDRHARANELIKRAPEEERAERRKKLGVSVRMGVAIPNPDGTASGMVGNLYINGTYGARAYNHAKPIEDVVLEVLEPGLVVGMFKPGALEKPDYLREAAGERAEVEALKASSARHAEADEEEKLKYAGLVIRADIECLEKLAKSKKKLSDKRLRKMSLRLQELATNGAPLAKVIIERWSEAAKNGEPLEPIPEHIASDPEAMAQRKLGEFKILRQESTRKKQ